jgi:formate-dependent nitrite reductase membrane component NrfD
MATEEGIFFQKLVWTSHIAYSFFFFGVGMGTVAVVAARKTIGNVF